MDLLVMNNVFMKIKQCMNISLLFILYWSSSSQAQQIIHQEYILAPFESQFVASREGKPVGYARLIFTQLPNKLWQLEYESKVSKYFLTDKRNETTRYLQTNEKNKPNLPLLPISYIYNRTGTGPDKSMSITFDHIEDEYLTSIPVDEEVQFPLNLRIDNQLFRIDVPFQLFKGNTEFNYKFINYRGQPRTYNIQVVTNESLDLPIGTLETIKVAIQRPASSRQTFAWFAPSLNYQLVRLQQFKHDKEQGDIQLRIHKAL